MAADVTLTNHGSLIGLNLLTAEARVWASEHLPEDASWFGGAVMVEPRYADAIVDGMMCDGLEVG